VTAENQLGEAPEATLTRELRITNRFGIHARPAALFVKTANNFQSEITVERNGLKVSGKSLIGLLTLEGYRGAVLRVTARGADAAAALQALEDLVQRNFFED